MTARRFPDEATVTAWEHLAHAARQAMAAAAPLGVARSYTAAVAQAQDRLQAALAEVVGHQAAAWAVTQWVIVDRPIADVAWYHRLAPGTRVAHRRDGRVGLVHRLDGDSGLAEDLDADHMCRWVSWSGEEAELVRVVDLEVTVG